MLTPRELVDKLHAGQPGWVQCTGCKQWYTRNGLEKHKCKAAPQFEDPYKIHCLTCKESE